MRMSRFNDACGVRAAHAVWTDGMRWWNLTVSPILFGPAQKKNHPITESFDGRHIFVRVHRSVFSLWLSVAFAVSWSETDDEFRSGNFADARTASFGLGSAGNGR